MAAPVHDATSVAIPATGLTRTWSHTCAAGVPTNGTLLAWGWVDSSSDVLTAFTYNGIAAAEILRGIYLNRYTYLARWPSPAAGAHNLVMTSSASISLAGAGWSFTNASQGNVSVVTFGGALSSTNFILSLDTIINDCLVGMFASNTVGAPTGVGASNTARDLTEARASITQVTVAVAAPDQVYPSFTIGSLAQWEAIAFALGPYVAPGGSSPTLLMTGSGG